MRQFPGMMPREVAAVRAKKHGASLILGSATPSVETSRRAREGKFGWYRLTCTDGQATLPEVSVVDLREELRDGNRSILSRRLLSAMDDRPNKKTADHVVLEPSWVVWICVLPFLREIDSLSSL